MKEYNRILSATEEELENLNHKNPNRVRNVDEYPYSAVGILLGNLKDKMKCHGTGSLIGSNLVLTVFHMCDPQGRK